MNISYYIFLFTEHLYGVNFTG